MSLHNTTLMLLSDPCCHVSTALKSLCPQVQFQKLQQLRLTQYHGGSLPNVSQLRSSAPEFQVLETLASFTPCEISAPWPGIEPRPSAVKAESQLLGHQGIPNTYYTFFELSGV